MRQERTVQASLFDRFAGHELKAMSACLDDHRELLGLVAADLRRHGLKETGRCRLPAEAVLRCAVLKQDRRVLDMGRELLIATWEQINRTLLTSARETKLERGRLVRLDSTVTAAPLHEPSDSSLLWDAVRVMVRLLREAQAWVG